MSELRNCPFCGGEAEMLNHFRIKKPKTYTFFRVGCKECGLRYPKFSDSREAATEAWNRRAEDENKN